MFRISSLSIALALISTQFSWAQPPSASQLEFFEQHIRPVLVEKCYKCHNSVDTEEAGLAVDFRDGIRAETEHGSVVIPGDLQSSLLLKVIRHEIDDLEMPEGGGKLDDEVIANFETWIKMGAPDPRNQPPTEDELTKVISWEATLANRKKWWSLQPVKNWRPPVVAGSQHPVDRFVQAKLVESNLQSTIRADRRTLIRRLSYVLTGLPPSTEQIRSFLDDDREDAYERLVDKMLASERFGERWARHWMDLMRYADSHGSEGDPAIPDIYRYRDYLIRAFNQDLPYDQLLREHVAGDLLETPRINEELGINESLIGPAHWRLVFHGFAPTDALDEKVRFTDDQINVFSKAFLGLTVSCARCHDHKFDAISQTDYYALFGILASCRPTLHDVNLPEKQDKHQQTLNELKKDIRQQVSQDWLAQLDSVSSKLVGSTSAWQEKIASHNKPHQLFYLLSQFTRDSDKETPTDVWEKLSREWKQYQEDVRHDQQVENAWHWDFADAEDYESWFSDGNGLPSSPTKAGEFRIGTEENVIAAILPAGVNANTASTKHRAFLGSPRFKLDREYKAWFRISGGGQSMTRYAVENYPRDGTVYPIRDINNKRWFLQEYNLKYWQGDYVHLEVNTARDAPLRTRGQDRSWFSIREVVVRDVNKPAPKNRNREFAGPLFATTRKSQNAKEMSTIYLNAIRNAIVAWQKSVMTDAQAVLLNECLLEGLLGNTMEQLPGASEAIDNYVRLENEIPIPTRVPGLMEADIFDQPLFTRGDHRKPANAVPRRFLEAINPTPFATQQSGRLELADNLVDPANPLVARVMVNRIWHHVFGQGIVGTPDNFGQLGERPSHPKLLDHLATRFAEEWSIKDIVRLLVTSETFKKQSKPSSQATGLDPRNRMLSHANVRRLDAESIRDALVNVSGRMSLEMYGKGFAANSQVPRRAVYVQTRRNSLDQFLEVFNAPIPFATTGRRSETNVPAQSLTMLNSPFVRDTATKWADRKDSADETSGRIVQMFESALGRLPSSAEATALTGYLADLEKQSQTFEQKHSALSRMMSSIEKQLENTLSPVRDRLRKSGQVSDTNVSVAPIAAWGFEDGLSDSIGELHGTAKGKAKVLDGALVLNGGFFITPPLQQDIKEKTLVATVELENLSQQGGGVVTVQTLNGVLFDSIVFGERQAGHWMAGSNGFTRTDDFGGPKETMAKDTPIQIAIAYDSNGTIRGYRNGERYGKPIRKGGLQHYSKGQAQVLLGLRHGDAGGDRILRGKIYEAQLFDRALSEEEIAAMASGTTYVRDQDVLAELTLRDQERVSEWRSELSSLKQQLSELGKPIPEQERWARLGHAIFNLKEFIYIK